MAILSEKDIERYKGGFDITACFDTEVLVLRAQAVCETALALWKVVNALQEYRRIKGYGAGFTHERIDAWRKVEKALATLTATESRTAGEELEK